MQRRKFLTGVLCIGGLSGCLGSSGSGSSDEQNSDGTPAIPDVQYNEKRLGQDSFALTVTVDLRGTDEVTFKVEGTEVATVTSSGTHKIAGEGTNYGPIENAKVVNAYSSANPDMAFSTHQMGSGDS